MTESREDRIAGIRARWQPLGREDTIAIQDIDFLINTIDANTVLADVVIETQRGLLDVHKLRIEAAVHAAVAKERRNCASIAEVFLGDSDRTPEYIAAAIRAQH